MSGRTRNKKLKSAAESTADILRRIQLTHSVSRDDILRLYHLDRPACQCRSNSKDSPHCLCGLIPGSARKHGLWQKLSDITDELGADPAADRRSSADVPAGLTNLGATCYVNSVLQCLYMNTAFRGGIFAAEMELVVNDPVLHQLARLFAQLQSGKRSSVDSAPFASILELDNAIQQDGQEFLKLLLSLLERVLAQSRVAEARDVVQNLFRGTFSYVTKCSKCGNESSASDQLVDFYEIEVNVRGFSGLEQSLDDYLSEEDLQGENQYSCEYCKTRVDATHSTKLRLLPPVLNFQLKRFVFNAKTSTKKKVTESFSFPKVLDMEKRVSSVMAEGPALYDLSAILLHKGKNASSGHYVAHIKDDRTGEWWQFDDEDVSVLGSHPLGEQESKDAKARSKDSDEALTSADAYMLMYSRRVSNLPDGSSNTKEERSRSLPEFLRSEVEELNENFVSSCDMFKLMKDDEVSRITDRKAEVRDTLANASASPAESFWILAEWLRNWADSLEPPAAIDNSQLLCEHQRVSPRKLHLMKCISEPAWQSLFSKYGGGPALTVDDCCLECIHADAEAVATAESYRSRRAAMKIMVENVLSGEGFEGELFYLSKSWLTQWLRKKTVDAPGESDAGPTSAITCPHDGLLPEQASGAKRQMIPEVLWSYFYQIALRVRKEDSVACKPFPINTETCKLCDIELNQTVCKQEDLRATKMEQRLKQEAVFSGRSLVLAPNVVYYLVPHSWISQWRAYIGASGKNVLDIERPVPLEGLVLSLLCTKHDGLLFKPPALIKNKRGELVQKTSPDDIYTVVSQEDWLSFCQEWNMDVNRGIKAFFEAEETKSNGKDVCEVNEPVLRTEPEVCSECIGDRESIELMDKLSYTNSTITVDLVQGKEPPPALLVSSDKQDAERRSSKRARRTLTTGSKRVSLTVSGTTTIYQLKMLIWEKLGVVKENQEVHFGRVELTDESATLADSGIFAGSRLWVSDSGVYEHRDIAEELSSAQQGQVEEGFREVTMPDYGGGGALPVRRLQKRRDDEADPLLLLPDLQAAPTPWKGAPIIAALVCIGFLMLQMMPATHYRLPNDRTRTWIPFANLSGDSSSGQVTEASEEHTSAREFVNEINSVPLNLFICTDEKDLRPVFVVINSTLSNTRHQKRLHFHIMTTEDQRETWLSKLSLFFPSANIHLLSVSDKLDLEAIRKRISYRKDSKAREALTTPFNFLPFYLPRMFPDMQKLVYLDSDVVVQGDIEELFSTDLENQPVAAVEDCSQKFKSGYFDLEIINGIRERENTPWMPAAPFDPEACVFNRGVLLFDPRRWTEENITEAIEWWMNQSLQSEKTIYRYGVSQPPFLLSVYGKYKKLDVSWNTRGLGRNELSEAERDYMGKMYSRRPARRPFLSPKTEHSKVLHFNGKYKPWRRSRELQAGDHPASLCGSKSEDCARLWWSYISVSTDQMLSHF